MITCQGQELIRRMQDGMTLKDALRFSNPIQAPKDDNNTHVATVVAAAAATTSSKKEAVRLTCNKLKGLKKDIETLSRVRDLRNVNSAVTQGNAKVKANASKDRREARRTIKKITNVEMEQDLQLEQEDLKWQQEEEQRLAAGYNDDDHHGDPQPSLLALVTFLKENTGDSTHH